MEAVQCGRYGWFVRDSKGKILVEAATEEEAREWIKLHLTE